MPEAIVVRSPDQLGLVDFKNVKRSIFLAGGISNCPNWQEDFIELFDKYRPKHMGGPTILVNPRRDGDLARTGPEAEAQIKWERVHLQMCSHIIFWFPKESICPITLFELGQYATKENLNSSKVLIGAEPEYPRYFDISTQLWLVSGKVAKVHQTLKQLVNHTIWATQGN